MSETISAWWIRRSIIAAAVTSSPKISPQAEKGLFEVTIIEARSLAGGDEREHQVRRLGVEGDVADFVDDDQGDPFESAQLVVEAPLALCLAEARDPLGRAAKRDPLAGEAGADRERDREVCLAGAGRVGVALLMLSIRCRSV